MHDHEIEFEEWLKDRPEIIKTMARTLKPWLRYKHKKTGQLCIIKSYSEDGTVKVEVNGHSAELLDALNKMAPIQVFGINPEDLEVIA